jgi:DNA-directed RNA polymerase subunit M/transcription elongation factor TFIIS
MSQIDPNEQWRVLQENYAAMADEELEAMAQEASDLTDIAQKVLQAEIARRHLAIEVRLNAPGQDESAIEEEDRLPEGYPEGFNPEDWGLISFSHVDNIEEARKLKASFDDAGIPSYYGPDVVDDLRLVPKDFKGSLEVKVREVDQARALAVLRTFAPARETAEGDEPSAYSCPKCHSTDIVFRKLEKSQIEPGESPKFSWKCYACGYRWKDDGIEP